MRSSRSPASQDGNRQRRRAAILCVALLGLGLPAPGRAQLAKLRFERLSREQNLSQVTVTDLVEDRQGFLWIATQDGLNRYNGYEITVFKHDPNDPESLSYSNIIDLYQDREGTLWIVPFGRGAIDRFDAATERFRRYRHDPADPRSLRDTTILTGVVHDDGRGSLWLGSAAGGIDRLEIATGEVTRLVHDRDVDTSISPGIVSALLEDRNGDLWVGLRGGGLDRVLFGADGSVQFEHHRHDPGREDSLSHDDVTALLEDSSGAIWIGTDRGLDRLRPESGAFESFRRPGDGPPGSDIVRPLALFLKTPLIEDRSGAIWIATAAGLSRLDPQRSEFRDYAPDDGDPTALRHASVSFMFQDRTGELWIGTQGGGLSLYRPGSDDFLAVPDNPADPQSLGSEFPTTALETRSGLLWFGTSEAGLIKFSRQKNAIRLYAQDPSDPDGLADDTVFALLEDSAGELWVGTMTGGLHRLDVDRTRVVERYAALPGSERDLGSDYVRALLEDRGGRFWVGTAGAGLVEIDRELGRVARRFRNVPGDPRSLSHDLVRSLAEDRRGRIWVATANGWNQFDAESGLFTRYWNDPDDPRSLPHNSTRFTYEDRSGGIWVGTDIGLGRFDPATREFTNFRAEKDRPETLSNDNVMDLDQDASGRFWVATYGGGLDLLDPETGRCRHFTTDDGLPNDSLYSVVPDGDGYLWIATNNGLSRFDPRTSQFVNLDMGHGLQGVEFNGRAFFRSPRGELFFGGMNGFNAFFPRDVRLNAYIPPIVLTGFRRMGTLESFDRAIHEVDEIVLGYRDKLIAFEFAALDFTSPEKNRYAFRLEGFDRDWVDAGTLRTAQYTNLDPGEYVFRVRGSNGDGVWNEEGASVRVVVVPPPWRQWWAYAIYMLLAGAGVVGLVHLKNTRHAAELEQHRVAAEVERKTRELEQARHLQMSMIPESAPDLPGLEIATFIRTATEVGGDYYDFFPQSDGSLYLAIGDATGHGLSAGMMVGMTRSAIHALGPGAPSAILGELNRVIRKVHPERMNMALSLVRISNGRVELSAAGMPPAFVRRAGSGEVEELLLPGLPLGSLESSGYLETARDLGPGDVLLLISDGLPELRTADGRELGYSEVEERLASCRAATAEEVVRSLVELGDDWRGARPADDDVTLVAIRRRTDS